MRPDQNVIALVTGATGAQGGAVARALLSAGFTVCALVRDDATPAAAALRDLGADLALGSFDDDASLANALRGASAVFSVQLFDPREPKHELAQASALIMASKRAGVRCFVQSTVYAVDLYKGKSQADDGLWDEPYWRSKAEVEDFTQNAGFASATILRPAFMMENFAPPKVARMFPELAQGRLRSCLAPSMPLALVAAKDIGAAAARAILDARAHATLELASDLLTPPEIAAALSLAWRRPIISESVTHDALHASGVHDGWIKMQRWMNSVRYPARIDTLSANGIAPTPLHVWAASIGAQASPHD